MRVNKQYRQRLFAKKGGKKALCESPAFYFDSSTLPSNSAKDIYQKNTGCQLYKGCAKKIGEHSIPHGHGVCYTPETPVPGGTVSAWNRYYAKFDEGVLLYGKQLFGRIDGDRQDRQVFVQFGDFREPNNEAAKKEEEMVGEILNRPAYFGRYNCVAAHPAALYRVSFDPNAFSGADTGDGGRQVIVGVAADTARLRGRTVKLCDVNAVTGKTTLAISVEALVNISPSIFAGMRLSLRKGDRRVLVAIKTLRDDKGIMLAEWKTGGVAPTYIDFEGDGEDLAQLQCADGECSLFTGPGHVITRSKSNKATGCLYDGVRFCFVICFCFCLSVFGSYIF